MFSVTGTWLLNAVADHTHTRNNEGLSGRLGGKNVCEVCERKTITMEREFLNNSQSHIEGILSGCLLFCKGTWNELKIGHGVWWLNFNWLTDLLTSAEFRRQSLSIKTKSKRRETGFAVNLRNSFHLTSPRWSRSSGGGTLHSQNRICRASSPRL